jgi:ATP-dependent RNA helicase SUPV3L1/SUV3
MVAACSPRASATRDDEARVKAVLGPTNTGKTHLAIERLCAHSSGMIGFPLRLLAREVYDRVCAIKGPERVALITGEERIERRDARWLLCTVEAMPVGADLAFVALDEAQLAADRERGHVFTDRLLHARGREETMLLGSATLEPLVRALVPGVEVVSRPRFSTLSHTSPSKLSRIPPRSAIVAFSAEQVYAVAEMLRRFRGGAAVVMGALSPQTRTAQVALYQSGEVDYLVATDAIGMGLNLDIGHVAFAGLSKFDGQRQRRLTPAEMAQIAGRAGRHQRDGTFGTLAGVRGPRGGKDPEFTPEEIYAIEEHRFAPLSRLFWREAEPRFDNLSTLIANLEAPPERPELAPAPEAINLGVLRRLAEEREIADTLTSPATLRRFWDACSLPDFRQQGVETHARFVARLWQDLRHGSLAPDHAPGAVAQLDNVTGDIDALQGRIAAIRAWSYIAQRPDWVPARAEMTARARAVEARLSDALHARLTERFVNRRTAVLMRKLGSDAALLPVRLEDDDVVVDGEAIGKLTGFRFGVDPAARHADHKLLLAAAERHLPGLLAQRANAALGELATNPEAFTLTDRTIRWHGHELAQLAQGRRLTEPRLVPVAAVERIPAAERQALIAGLDGWLLRRLRPLAPLAAIEQASTDPVAGSDLRALLIRLTEAGGILARAGSGLDRLDKRQREQLRRLRVRVGALDLWHPGMLRAGPLALWRQLRMVHAADAETAAAPVVPAMTPVLPAGNAPVPAGYRALGRHWLRVDKAEDLLREAHTRRVASPGRPFVLDPAPAMAMGLPGAAYARLLHQAGFRPLMPRPLEQGAHGPRAPLRWRWQMPRGPRIDSPPPADNAFAALARLVA